MKSLLKLACLYFTSAGMAFGATSVTITFDDLAPPWDGSTYEGPIPNGYDGFQWNNFYVMDAALLGAVNGYKNGMVSANNVAFNAAGNPAMFSAGSFDLNSAYLTAAWNDGLQVEVQGFVGTTLTYDNTYTVNTTGPTLLDFNYLGVDEVSFISSGGVPNGNYLGGPGTQFVMDNLAVTIPEPNLLALACLGAAALMVWHRRTGNGEGGAGISAAGTVRAHGKS
jgi:hypothetical protein